MGSVEVSLFWVTIFLYVGAFVSQIFGFINKKDKPLRFSSILIITGFIFHAATGIIHWIASKHPPVTDTYELNLTGVWFMIMLFLLFRYLRKINELIGLVILPIGFLTLGYGYLSGVEIIPMGPAFQSPWLIVHVIFAWLAFGSYAISTGAAIFLLLKVNKLSSERLKKLPPADELDMTGYRFIVLGFINHAIMIVSGAIWAKKLWGHYWNWDPLETWSLIAFLFYAFYLHARSFLNWKMKKSAWLAVAGLIILAISFWGVGWFGPTMHPGP